MAKYALDTPLAHSIGIVSSTLTIKSGVETNKVAVGHFRRLDSRLSATICKFPVLSREPFALICMLYVKYFDDLGTSIALNWLERAEMDVDLAPSHSRLPFTTCV